MKGKILLSILALTINVTFAEVLKTIEKCEVVYNGKMVTLEVSPDICEKIKNGDLTNIPENVKKELEAK